MNEKVNQNIEADNNSLDKQEIKKPKKGKPIYIIKTEFKDYVKVFNKTNDNISVSQLGYDGKIIYKVK